MKSLVHSVVVVAWLAVALAGCSGGRSGPPEGTAASSGASSDYALFALRCSKCHSLARPLNSGIDTDEYWQLYVERMRRQPGSGISVEDTVGILRFLHAYSIEQRRKKGKTLEPLMSSPLERDASSAEGAP